jgi:hypothetical protein
MMDILSENGRERIPEIFEAVSPVDEAHSNVLVSKSLCSL